MPTGPAWLNTSALSTLSGQLSSISMGMTGRYSKQTQMGKSILLYEAQKYEKNSTAIQTSILYLNGLIKCLINLSKIDNV